MSSIADVMKNLYITVIKPAIIESFTINATPPEILVSNGNSMDPFIGKQIIIPNTMSGQIFFFIHVNIPKMGLVQFTIIYNVYHESSAPNQFIRILIEQIDALTNEKVESILTLVVKLANQLDVKLVNVENVHTIKPHSWNEIDLLMILYTNQSLFSSVGFIQLTYPQMLTDIRLLLYTPLSELMIPDINEILVHFGLTPIDTLNTLFFILYPIYIDHKCTLKDLKYVKRLYHFLITSNNNVELYTQTTMCVPYKYPVPGSIPAVPLDPMYQQPYQQGNLLENLLREVDIRIMKYGDEVIPGKSKKRNNRVTKKIKPNTDTITQRL